MSKRQMELGTLVFHTDPALTQIIFFCSVSMADFICIHIRARFPPTIIAAKKN
jgi:hypothetical protein